MRPATKRRVLAERLETAKASYERAAELYRKSGTAVMRDAALFMARQVAVLAAELDVDVELSELTAVAS